MKAILKTLAGALCLLYFTSCNGDTEYHYTAIIHPNGDQTLFADQTEDSIKFVTFDSWTLSLNSDWMHMDEVNRHGTVPSGYYLNVHVPLTFDVNNTGRTRTATASVSANGNTLSAGYTQLHYLNVKRPQRRDNSYQLTDSAHYERDSLQFVAYGNWTVEFVGEQPAWVQWENPQAISGRKGEQKIYYTLVKNETDTKNEAQIRLTSNGVPADITLVQLPRKKEEAPAE